MVSKSFKQHRALALGIYGLSASLGTMTMPLTQDLLLTEHTKRATIRIIGCMTLPMLVGSMLLISPKEFLRQAKEWKETYFSVDFTQGQNLRETKMG
jgi:hypothetical protein